MEPKLTSDEIYHEWASLNYGSVDERYLAGYLHGIGYGTMKDRPGSYYLKNDISDFRSHSQAMWVLGYLDGLGDIDDLNVNQVAEIFHSFLDKHKLL